MLRIKGIVCWYLLWLACQNDPSLTSPCTLKKTDIFISFLSQAYGVSPKGQMYSFSWWCLFHCCSSSCSRDRERQNDWLRLQVGNAYWWILKLLKCLLETGITLKMVLAEAQYVLSCGTNIFRMPGHCYSICLDWMLENNMKRKFYCSLLATQAAFLKLQWFAIAAALVVGYYIVGTDYMPPSVMPTNILAALFCSNRGHVLKQQWTHKETRLY